MDTRMLNWLLEDSEPSIRYRTLRELLEDDGYARHAEHIGKLEGSARAFFDNEFRGKEFGCQYAEAFVRHVQGRSGGLPG